jgi:formylglycine-generating enzyme required for sulfatase activity
MKHVVWKVVVAGAGMVLAGCGSEQPSAPPPSAPPPSAPPPASIPILTGPAKSKPGGQAARTSQKIEKAPSRPDVPPELLFEIGQGIPNFALLPRDEANPADVFVLAAPGIGEDSSTVTLIPPDVRTTISGTGAGGLAVPAGFTAVAKAGFSPEGLPRQIVCQKDGSTMALIPAGLFSQGIDGADPNAGPLHPVELSAYYMDITEVTLEQYLRFRGAEKPTPGRPVNESSPGNHPVLGVSWRDAQAYCRWVGKELPTEGQWEQAARGPGNFVYVWGNDPRTVWQRVRTPEQIDAVGSYPADRSPYGIFDLAGNAREWCLDYYAEDAYQHASKSDGTAVRDGTGPKRPSISAHRVVRGNAPGWELWYRSSESMSKSSPSIGFRGVLQLAAAQTDATGPSPPGEDGGPPPTVRPRGSQSGRGASPPDEDSGPPPAVRPRGTRSERGAARSRTE